MIEFEVSNSGYPVLYYQKKDSLTSTCHILNTSGSAHEDDDSFGVAHFLEHMAYQGTPDKNKHQISREMGLNGAFNAYTSYFETSYYFETLNEKFDKCFQLLKESVFDSCYPEKEFEKEKQVILEEWRMYDNQPQEHYKNFALDNYFGKELHPIIGNEESIQGMNPEKLHRFRNKWYGKQNTFIVAVGGKPFREIMDIINNSLQKSVDATSSHNCLANYNKDQKDFSFTNERFEQSVWGFIQPWCNANQIIDMDYLPIFLTNCISTYLYEYIRDELGMCYGIRTGRICSGMNSFLTSYILTSKDKMEKLKEEIDKSFNEIKQNGFHHDIVEMAKFSVVYDQFTSIDSIYGICNYIKGLISLEKDVDWVLNKGSKILDSNLFNRVASELNNKKLTEAANCLINNQSYFSMYSK